MSEHPWEYWLAGLANGSMALYAIFDGRPAWFCCALGFIAGAGLMRAVMLSNRPAPLSDTQ